jgi:hypothetical protein
VSGSEQRPPVRCWFKLVGATKAVGTGDPRVPDDWAAREPGLFDLARFPRHRQPTNISNYERVILYAVGKGVVFAAQRRAGAIRINKPHGPVGSVTDRWPHEMEMETFAWVPDLRNAPTVQSVLPRFMTTYRKNFWNGSHWLIDDDELAAFEAAIIAAGEGGPVAMPPWLATDDDTGGAG